MKKKKADIPSDLQLEGFISLVEQDRKYGIRNSVIIHLSYFAGLRAKEISALDMSDIYTADGDVKHEAFVDTKGDGGREILIQEPRLRSILSKYYEVRKRSATPNKKVQYQVVNRSLILSREMSRMSANSIAHLLLRLYKLHGLWNEDIRCSSHSGRRYFATKLADVVSNTRELMAHGGWKSANVALEYVEVAKSKLKSNIARAFRDDKE
jgi:integrase/recombinase XerD